MQRPLLGTAARCESSEMPRGACYQHRITTVPPNREAVPMSLCRLGGVYHEVVPRR